MTFHIRELHWILRLLGSLLALTWAVPARSQSPVPTSTSIAVSANPQVYGRALTISATVTPPGATGKITFYAGTSILGTSVAISGRAIMATTLLPTGVRLLRAVYRGDSVYGASRSIELAETVISILQNGFKNKSAYGSENYSAYFGEIWGSGGAAVFSDLNGDGNGDLVIANETTNNVSVVIGNGDGSFRKTGSGGSSIPIIDYPYGVGESPTSIAVADLNGDGKTDIAVASNKSNSVSLLTGKGDGTFNAAYTVPTRNSP